MARAKNTDRAEARRKYRAARAAELGVAEDSVDDEPTLVTGAEPAARPRTSLFSFQRPDIRGDLRALPGMFRTRRLLWLPFVLVVVTFLLIAAVETGTVPADSPIAGIAGFAGQLLLAPPSILPPFVVGFLAPRGSYLVGGLAGLFTGLAYAGLIFISPAAASADAATRGSILVNVLGMSLVLGVLIGAFGAAYRNMFRRSSERQRELRAERARREAAQRKETKRQTRPTSARSSRTR